MDRSRCYAGNRGVEEAIMSGSGSTLFLRLMQLRVCHRCAARTYSIEMGHGRADRHPKLFVSISNHWFGFAD